MECTAVEVDVAAVGVATHGVHLGAQFAEQRAEIMALVEQVFERGKVIGFSGPVLADDDPYPGNVERRVGRLRVRMVSRLPCGFWKVVVVAGNDGALSTASFAVNQEVLLKQKRLKLPPDAFLCTVADIEKLTRLDFGKTIRKAARLRL